MQYLVNKNLQRERNKAMDWLSHPENVFDAIY